MEASPAPDRYAAVRKIQTPLGQSLGSRVTSYAHIQPPTARVGVPMHTCRIGVPDPIHQSQPPPKAGAKLAPETD